MPSLEELNLVPLGGQAEQPHYTQYWTETYLPALKELGVLKPIDEIRIRRAGEFVTRVADLVIPAGHRMSLPNYPECFIDAESSLEDILWQWNTNLGSLNSLNGAQEGVLRAAQHLIASRILIPEHPEFEQFYRSGNVTFTDAFLHTWEEHPMRTKRQSYRLFQAGEMVHKASMLEPEASKREQLTVIATRLYRQFTRYGEFEGLTDIKGYNYIGDIEYAELMEQAHRDAKNGIGKESQAWEDMGEMLRQDATMIHDMYAKFSAQKNFNRTYLGHLFVDFNILALRRKVWREKRADIHVRHSFEHEDHTLRYTRPRSSFDMVIERHTPDGVRATPVEVRMVRWRGERAGRTKADHLPGMQFARFSGMDHPIQMKALKQFAEGDEGKGFWASQNRVPFERIEDRFKKQIGEQQG